MFKSIVFDLDGTLIDSPLCFKKIRNALQIPESEYILEYLEGMEPEKKAAHERILEDIEVEAAKESQLMEGVLEFFSHSCSQGIKTGIFTRNCRAVTDIVMAKFSLPVDIIITREDAKPKPDPEGLLQLLKRWQIAPEDMLYIGDYHFDIECGKLAGVKTALFTGGKPYESDFDADFIVHSYSDLTRQLKFE